MKVRWMRLKNYKILLMSNFIVGLVGLLSGIITYFILIPKTIVVKTSVLMRDSYFSNAAMMPKLWTIAIIMSSVSILCEGMRNKEKYLNAVIDLSILKTEILYIFGILISMSMFVFLMPLVGYVISGIILLITFIWFIYGYHNIPVTLSIGILLPILLKVFFERYLYIIMPTLL